MYLSLGALELNEVVKIVPTGFQSLSGESDIENGAIINQKMCQLTLK